VFSLFTYLSVAEALPILMCISHLGQNVDARLQFFGFVPSVDPASIFAGDGILREAYESS
jgi:hypothetical protein